jgi:hypothetical protein
VCIFGGARPPQPTWHQQQARFRTFRYEYNELRPHEGLGDETPASQYPRSTRRYPRRLPPLAYPAPFEQRLVSGNGGIPWCQRRVPENHAVPGQYIGLEEIHDGEWDVYVGPLKLGRFHERTYGIEDALGRAVGECYPCLRTDLLPMSPAAHKTHTPGDVLRSLEFACPFRRAMRCYGPESPWDAVAVVGPGKKAATSRMMAAAHAMVTASRKGRAAKY